MIVYHNTGAPFQLLPPLRPGQSKLVEIAGEPWVVHCLSEHLYLLCESDSAGECRTRAQYRVTDGMEWGAAWGQTPADRACNFARLLAMCSRAGARLRLHEKLHLFVIEG